MYKDINKKICELEHMIGMVEIKICSSFELPSNPKEGVIYILKNDEEYIYTGKTYEKIGNFKNIEYPEYDKPKIEYTPKARICTCCGAALHGFICDYCGVEYK